MSKIPFKAGTLLSPLPAALVSCGSLEKPNAMTAAWTGIVCSNPPRTYVSIRPSRYSHGLIEQSGVYVINLTTEKLAFAADYCGVRSGRDENKFARCGLTAAPSLSVECPSIEQSPLSLECRVFDILRLGSHDMFLADITAVTVDEQLMDKSGKLRLDKAGILAYAHGEYSALGPRIGTFGWSVKKKKK